VLVFDGAAFQSVFPAWLATTLTDPAPMNDRLVPVPSMLPGGGAVKLTPRPLEAVADSLTVFVVS